MAIIFELLKLIHTLMPCHLETTRSGRNARRVLKTRNALIWVRFSEAAAKLTTEIWNEQVDKSTFYLSRKTQIRGSFCD